MKEYVIDGCVIYYGMLVIDEEQAEIVRIIYNLYLGGATALGIKRELERRGIKSPTGKDRWNKSTIEKIHNRSVSDDIFSPSFRGIV